MNRLLLTIFLVSFGFSLTLGAQVPDWLDNADKRFPRDKYVNAIGRGSTEEAAKQDALSQIGQYFGVEINTASLGTQNFRSLREGDRESSRFDQDIQKKVTVKSSQKLFAVEYSQPFALRPSEIVVAAGLDRKAATAAWSALYRDTGSRISQLMELARNPRRSLSLRLSAWKGAEALVIQGRDQEEKLRLLEPSTPPPSLAYDREALLDLREELTAGTRMVLEVQGAESGRLESLLSSLITKAGFQTGPGGGFQLKTNLVLTTSRSGYGLSAAQWRLEAGLQEGTAQIHAVVLQGKTGGSSPEAAADKALTEALRQLETQFVPELISRMTAGVEF